MKWFRGNDRDRASRRYDDFDPVKAGDAYGLTPEVSKKIWKAIRRTLTHNFGQRGEQRAQQRFDEEARRVARRGGRLLPAPGKNAGWDLRDYLDYIAPGKVTPEDGERWQQPRYGERASVEAIDTIAPANAGTDRVAMTLSLARARDALRAPHELGEPEVGSQFWIRTGGAYGDATERKETAALAERAPTGGAAAVSPEAALAERAPTGGAAAVSPEAALAERAPTGGAAALSPEAAVAERAPTGGAAALSPEAAWGGGLRVPEVFRRGHAKIAEPTAEPVAEPTAELMIASSGPRSVAAPREARLPAPMLERMERAYGQRFDDVEIHTDSPEVPAGEQAFTKGRHIYFERGAFDLDSEHGEHVVAHELAHVAQQSQPSPLTGASHGPAPRAALEAEAHQAALSVLAGRAATVKLFASPVAALGFSRGEAPHAAHEDVTRRAAGPAGRSTAAEPARASSTDANAHDASGRGAKRDAASARVAAPAEAEPGAARPDHAKASADAHRGARGGGRGTTKSDAAANRSPAVQALGGGLVGPMSTAAGRREGAPRALDARDPGAMLASLAHARPSSAVATLAQVRGASPAAFDAQREQARASIPSAAAPTGLPAKGTTLPPRSPAVGPSSTVEDPLKPKAASRNAEVPETLVREAPAAPAPTPTRLPGAGGDESRQLSSGDAELIRRAQQALAGVGLPAGYVSTQATDVPTVDLTGEADPEQLTAAHAASVDQTRIAARAAAAAIHQDFGENDVFPAASHETLTAMSVSALSDGAAVTLFDGSRSRSRALLRRAGMGIGYQREIT